MSVALTVGLLGLALAILLVAWVLAALRGDGRLPTLADGGLLALLTERQALLASLRDLDADLAAGRMNAEAHAQLREDTLRAGSRLLARWDAAMARSRGSQAEALEAIESAVSAARGFPRGSMGAGGDLSAAQGVRPPAPCPTCGRNTAQEDRFCRHCGHDLRPLKRA